MAQHVHDSAGVRLQDEGGQLGYISLNVVLEARLKSRIAELEDHNSVLAGEKERIVKQLAALQQTCDDVTSELSSVKLAQRRELAALRDEAAQMKLQLADAQAAAGETRLHLDAARAEVHAILAARETGTSSLRAMLSKCESELENKCKETTTLSRKLGAADSLADALEQELKVLQQTLGKMACRMQTQEAGLKLQENRILEVVKIGENLAEQVQRKTAALTAAQLQVKELQQQRLAAEEQHVKRRQQLEKQVQETQLQLQDAQAANNSFQEQLDQQTKAKDKEVGQLLAQLQLLEADHAHSKQQVCEATDNLMAQQASSAVDISDLRQQRDACVLAMVLWQQAGSARFNKLLGVLDKASSAVAAARRTAALRAAEAAEAVAAAFNAKKITIAAQDQAKDAEVAAAQARAAEAAATKAAAAAKAEAVVARAEAARMQKALLAGRSEIAASVTSANDREPIPPPAIAAVGSVPNVAAADLDLEAHPATNHLPSVNNSTNTAVAATSSTLGKGEIADGVRNQQPHAGLAAADIEPCVAAAGRTGAAAADVAAVPCPGTGVGRSKRPAPNNEDMGVPAATRQKMSSLSSVKMQQQQPSLNRPVLTQGGVTTASPVLSAPKSSSRASLQGQPGMITQPSFAVQQLHQNKDNASSRVQGYHDRYASSNYQQTPYFTTAASLLAPVPGNSIGAQRGPYKHHDHQQQQQQNAGMHTYTWQQQQQPSAQRMPQPVKLPALKMQCTGSFNGPHGLSASGKVPVHCFNQPIPQHKGAHVAAQPCMVAGSTSLGGPHPAAAAGYRTFGASLGAHASVVQGHCANLSHMVADAAAAGTFAMAAGNDVTNWAQQCNLNHSKQVLQDELPSSNAAAAAPAAKLINKQSNTAGSTVGHYNTGSCTAQPVAEAVQATVAVHEMSVAQELAGDRNGSAAAAAVIPAAPVAVADTSGAMIAAVSGTRLSCQQQRDAGEQVTATAVQQAAAAAAPPPRAAAQPTTAMGMLFCALADDNDDDDEDDSSSQLSARGVL